MENYTKIENDILEQIVSLNLSGTEHDCLLILFRKTNGFHKSSDGISLTQFQQLTNRSRPAICKALKKLRLVKICLLVKSGKSAKTFNIYTINKNIKEWKLVNKPLLVKKRKQTSKENDTQLVKKSIHTKETITKENIQKKETEELFNEFWEKYPKKVGKIKAIKKYQTKKHDEIMKGLEAYLVYWKKQKTELQYIPNPETWLNQERWKDELIEIRPSSIIKRGSEFFGGFVNT